MMRSPTLLAALLFSLLLAGCSSVTQPPAPALLPAISWASHQASLLPLTHWTVSGKIGIRTNSNSQTANLHWQQRDETYEIDMTGPWGQGGAFIAGEPGHVRIDLAGEGSYEATSPEQLLEETLGWEIPVQHAHWWVRGLPAPYTPYQHQLQDNRLALLEQDGWTIRYLRYTPGAIVLPSKLRLSRNGLQITLLLKEWQTP